MYHDQYDPLSHLPVNNVPNVFLLKILDKKQFYVHLDEHNNVLPSIISIVRTVYFTVGIWFFHNTP